MNNTFPELSLQGFTSIGYTFNSQQNANKEARKFERVGYDARVLRTTSNHVFAMTDGYYLMIKRK